MELGTPTADSWGFADRTKSPSPPRDITVCILYCSDLGKLEGTALIRQIVRVAEEQGLVIGLGALSQAGGLRRTLGVHQVKPRFDEVLVFHILDQGGKRSSQAAF